MGYLQNIKIWCNNNLGEVGKWGGVSFLFGIILTVLVSGTNFSLRAYILDPISTNPNQPTELKLNYNPISNINDTAAPVNNIIKNAINSFKLNGVSPSPIKSPSAQNLDFSKFFSSSTASSNDIFSFLKEAAVTVINLTIVVISITVQVFKGVFSALKQ